MATHPPPGFRGRAGEREVLDRLLDRARSGHSGVLVVRGEAGIGKTALLRYAARKASGFRVDQIAGIQSEMELPFAGLHQLCGPMLDRLDALPEPQRAALSVAFGLAPGDAPDRFLVALAALSLLSDIAGERPLLCVVDDAHWLDAASAQVLGFVARRLLADPVAMVFAVREPSQERELAGLPALPLEGLAEDEARDLLTTVVPGLLDERVRDRVVAETRGNPLALLELPRGMSAAELAGGFALPDAGDLPGQIEGQYLRRVAALPDATRRLMLLASADPVGDATLLWRAAQTLAIDRTAADPAMGDLLEIGARVRFRHPLVRSAVYRAATAEDRRTAHHALATATDPQTDPDRRAWHRAHAAAAPDEAVADELIACADGAQRRGGIAAAAAFLERAAALTPDPAQRASRALAAARAKFGTGDFAAAESLLARATAGPLDALDQARVELTWAQMAFDQRRGRDAPQLLLHAARRLEPLDPELARDTHLEALVAAIYAGRLANGDDMAQVALGARSAPMDDEPLPPQQLLLRGLAIRLTDGCVAAAPTLRRALSAYREQERQLDRMCLAYNIVAEELWDDEAWLELAGSQAEMARATGTLLLLPYALDYLAGAHMQRGELSVAGELLAEAEGLDLGVRAEFPLRLAAFRGQAATALPLVEVMTNGALKRGEGCAIAAVGYSEALLYNGLGQYELALEAAQKATATDDIVTSSWALYELVEAASRSGRPDLARDAARRLCERTAATDTAWAAGAAARSRAPGSATASGCGARTGASTPASSCARPTSCSPRWAARPSPTAPGASCSPPARRCAGAATTRATTSRPRRSRSPAWPGTGAPTRRSAPSSSSARARSSGTCARCSPSSASALARACTTRCPAATRRPRRLDAGAPARSPGWDERAPRGPAYGGRMLLTQVIRGAAITGRTDVVSTRLLGRQGGRWAQQWVDSALPEAARRTPGAPPPPPRAPAPPPDAATAARVLEDLHRRGLLTDAELARLRAARGI